MRAGILSRTVVFSHGKGRRTRLNQRRFVSMKSPHIAGLETTLTPENWSGSIKVVSAIDGRVDNTLVKRYSELNNHHLDQIGSGIVNDETIWLQVETNQSHVRVAEATRTRVFHGRDRQK